MTDFTMHTPQDAPEGSSEILQGAQDTMGFVPNLFGLLAESPEALEAYTRLSGLFDRTSLSPVEREVVLLAASVYNECAFCVAAHSGRAKKAGMDEGVLEALRAGDPLPDPRLDALAGFTWAVVHERGWVGDERVNALIEAGFDRRQVLDVVLGVSMKTLSNYTNHIVGTPLNEQLEPLAWKKAG